MSHWQYRGRQFQQRSFLAFRVIDRAEFRGAAAEVDEDVEMADSSSSGASKKRFAIPSANEIEEFENSKPKVLYNTSDNDKHLIF